MVNWNVMLKYVVILVHIFLFIYILMIWSTVSLLKKNCCAPARFDICFCIHHFPMWAQLKINFHIRNSSIIFSIDFWSFFLHIRVNLKAHFLFSYELDNFNHYFFFLLFIICYRFNFDCKKIYLRIHKNICMYNLNV